MTPVVAVHGVGLDRRMWDWFAADFDSPLITYDTIGHGGGPHPPGPYSLRMYADQLADVAGGEPVDLIGFSMGALIAQRFAVDYPQRVRRLVLVSGVYDRTQAERAAIVKRVDDVRDGGYLASVDAAIQRWCTPAFSAAHPDRVDAVRRRMLANDVTSYANAYEVFATGDAELVAEVPNVLAPTLVVTGEHDPRSTPSMTRALAEALPHGRSVVMPGLHHLVPVEAPRALADLVRAFLEEELSHA